MSENLQQELPKFLPMNVRIRIVPPQELAGQPSIICALPNNPGNPASIVQAPGILEIELIDPTDKQPKWFAVPFALPAPPPIIQVRR